MALMSTLTAVNAQTFANHLKLAKKDHPRHNKSIRLRMQHAP